ncbi:odorant receptor Or1 isoform X1 [Megachile rotundata]|uniref:odorant receptor Or1 isoform X1 n=1 Tax=Megachile rotundata TaxID=143995 RepID=UPI003FD074B0
MTMIRSEQEVHILQPAFNILTICGCWKPRNCHNRPRKVAYVFYTSFVCLALYSFCISQFLNLIINVRTADDLSESLYMFIASVLACCKIVTLLINRNAIKVLVKRLQEEPSKPRNCEEKSIQDKFDKNIGSITIYYTILVEITVVCMILSSLYSDFKDRKLLYRAWLPFNYSISKLYYMAYVHQITSLVGTSLLNVACDVIFCGLVVYGCSQHEILKCRLKGLTKESNVNIGKIVHFHDHLYGYTSMVQEKFQIIMGIQLASSTLVVCFILYKLTNTPMNSTYLQFVLYMACMMSQIYFYCWYGNELKLKYRASR